MARRAAPPAGPRPGGGGGRPPLPGAPAAEQPGPPLPALPPATAARPPVEPSATAAADPSDPAKEPLPLGAQAVTDGGQVRKVLEDLNALLAAAGSRDTYRVTEAKAVDGDRLVSVRIESRGPDGGIRRSFEAVEARFLLLPTTRTLEIRLRSGSVTYLGKRTVRFLDGEHTAYLEVDPAPFRSSGNPVITVR